MLQIFQRLLRKPVRFVQSVLKPPEHIRLVGFGNSLQECLRDLEKAAHLPVGDLYVKYKTIEEYPVFTKNYFVGSKTADLWKADSSKQGYVAGCVVESFELAKSDGDGGYKFLGSLHISKNCPGVYYENVCTTCGDVAP